MRRASDARSSRSPHDRLLSCGPARGDFSLFVATGDNTITQLDSTGGAQCVFASTNIFAPQGVVADHAGNIYVANPIDNTIEAFSPAGVDLGPVAFTGLNGPFPLAFHGGSLFAGNTGDGRRSSRHFTSGVDLGPFTTTNLNHTRGTRLRRLRPTLRERRDIQRDRSLPRRRGPTSAPLATTGLSGPQAIAFDAAGRLYAANFFSDTIERFAANGTDLGTFASTGLNGPVGLAFDPSGNLYVANFFDGTIEQFAPDGTDLGAFASGLSGMPDYLTIVSTSAPAVPRNRVPSSCSPSVSALACVAKSVVRPGSEAISPRRHTAVHDPGVRTQTETQEHAEIAASPHPDVVVGRYR